MTESNKAFMIIEQSINSITDEILTLTSKVESVDENKITAINSIQDIAAISEESAAATEEVLASMEEESASMEIVVQTTENLEQVINQLNEIVNKFSL